MTHQPARGAGPIDEPPAVDADEIFRRAFHSGPAGLVITDLGGIITLANPAFAAMVGDDAAALVGVSLFDLVDPTDIEVSDDEFDHLVAQGPQARLYDRRLIARDGRTLWTALSVSLLDDEDGNPIGCIAHVLDVTERHQARMALETSRRELAALNDITRAGLEAKDMAEAALRVAAVIGEVMGFPGVAICIEDLEHDGMRTVAARFDDHDHATGRALCAAAALSRQPVATKDDSITTPRTTLAIPIQIDDDLYGAVTLTDHAARQVDQAQITRATGFADHIASFLRRMRAEEALSALIRSKDQFIASVSHEVRTPLTAVVGLAAELRDHHDELGADELAEIMDIVAEQSTEVADIVEDLLVAARTDLDALSLEMERFEAHEQVVRVIRELDRFVAGRPVLTTPIGTAEAFADRGRFRQIIRNLITNAFRYGGPEVEIAIDEIDDGMASVRVSDDGDGVPAGEWETIFEPYQRSQNAFTQPGSVGIGLTVSRKLARMMGGDLTYRYARGRSTFELLLPQMPQPQSAESTEVVRASA